jgi:hypothetical protein
MSVHDDFKLFFDPAKTGMQNDIYKESPDSELLYGEHGTSHNAVNSLQFLAALNT